MGGSEAIYSSTTDEKLHSPCMPQHAKRPGDLRSAITPFLAHSYLVNTSRPYKWMLYGDDDTLFFIPNVLRLLEGLDHLVPLAISDDLW